MDRVTDTHVYFWGSIFSNWANCELNYNDEWFANSEQAFVWRKAIFFHDYKTADLILKETNPRVAKELGRAVKNFVKEEWDEVCYRFMVEICWAKFSQNPGPRADLYNTGNKIIVEASPTDNIWGVGLHWDDDRVLDEKNWNGQNLLGKALMEVRSRLYQGSIQMKHTTK